ncbi:MAG: hypothetical protein HKL88_00070 [Bacteroidia bacterium]|jgi:hypothetical protein|nr:hypothetical protein [Bacteroidia bacterium]
MRSVTKGKAKKIILALTVCLPCLQATAQQLNLRDSVSTGFLVQVSYAAQLPGGNLAQMFGFNSNLGGCVLYKTHHNWFFGAQGQFIFGNQLRQPGLLDSIATHDGNIIGSAGDYPQITYFERGYAVELSAGKLFHLGKNVNSGILLMGSVGYIRHKVFIDIQGGEYTPQLTGQYLYGYDHLTAGACVSEFAGYQYLGPKKMLNFFAGFEFMQGFTKSLRYDFETRMQNTNLQYDLLNGIRVGWILPIYTSHRQDVSFYTH